MTFSIISQVEAAANCRSKKVNLFDREMKKKTDRLNGTFRALVEFEKAVSLKELRKVVPLSEVTVRAYLDVLKKQGLVTYFDYRGNSIYKGKYMVTDFGMTAYRENQYINWK